MKKVREYLKSSDFGTITIIGLSLVLAIHNYFIFYSLTPLPTYWKEATATIASLLISSAICFYTLRGREKVAYWFAAYEIYMNIYYFTWYIIMNEDLSLSTFHWVYLIPAIPISIAIPLTLKRYAFEMKEEDLIPEAEYKKEELSELINKEKDLSKIKLLRDIKNILDKKS